MRSKYFLFLLATIFLISSCVTVDDGVDLFFMGENSLQYFFPSREWVSSDEELILETDWLYRTFSLENEEGSGRTILNFSLYSETDMFRRVPDRIILSSGKEKIVISVDQITLVYLDRGKTRYSSWLYSSDLDQIMKVADGDMKIILEFDEDLLFTATPEFIPQIEYFKEVLLGIPPN